MESQLFASCSDCDALQAANDDMLQNGGTDQEESSTLRACVLKLETEVQTPHTS